MFVSTKAKSFLTVVRVSNPHPVVFGDAPRPLYQSVEQQPRWRLKATLTQLFWAMLPVSRDNSRSIILGIERLVSAL